MSTTSVCQAILDGTTANSEISFFDQGAGSIYLVGGTDCWAAVQSSITNSITQAETGLATLEALHFPTDIVQKELEEFERGNAYADGAVLFTAWQWDESTLITGDQVGVCVYQSSGSSTENHASCWGLNYEGNGNYSRVYDYLVKPSTIGSNSTLESFAAIDASYPQGTNGTWIVSQPEVATGTTKRVSAIRFNPIASSTSDPAVYQGTTEVVTYLSTRDSTTGASETLFSADHMMLKQTNNFTSNAKWSSESVELACYNGATCSAPAPVDTGAVSVTSAGAAIVALAAMLTF